MAFAAQSTPVGLVRTAAARSAGARFEVVPVAGHFPSIDQPEIVAGLTGQHIEAHANG
jgi:3-oxoadipate enol-lactonase